MKFIMLAAVAMVLSGCVVVPRHHYQGHGYYRSHVTPHYYVPRRGYFYRRY